jgi:hypothetical protein
VVIHPVFHLDMAYLIDDHIPPAQGWVWGHTMRQELGNEIAAAAQRAEQN